MVKYLNNKGSCKPKRLMSTITQKMKDMTLSQKRKMITRACYPVIEFLPSKLTKTKRKKRFISNTKATPAPSKNRDQFLRLSATIMFPLPS